MRRKKRLDLLVVVALFVGFGLIATALSKEFARSSPGVLSLGQMSATNVDSRYR